MIRIVYTWHVEPEKMNLFIETWKKTTNTIHQQIKGAKGSFMIQNNNNIREIKTVARWDSLEHWESFWQGNGKTKMGSMHELGHRVSVEVFKEIDDFTR
ncbi:antibiotic biosynthesis monooxygenase [Flagellimonas meridianipacifica]|uniref:Antibiotic biosynthesis monooxygenase n=1 Tax=Flagellimonas meridianipacifica TaxID=1080225 RepID=A0A2T0MH48_9FLAO|nr:antibiotic biosynthesis monooxygenase [Allomuricauda pacifica]PRX56885.1 antibiotic biosynthesis monooxygenase [Allomuricauda pacifica]